MSAKEKDVGDMYIVTDFSVFVNPSDIQCISLVGSEVIITLGECVTCYMTGLLMTKILCRTGVVWVADCFIKRHEPVPSRAGQKDAQTIKVLGTTTATEKPLK